MMAKLLSSIILSAAAMVYGDVADEETIFLQSPYDELVKAQASFSDELATRELKTDLKASTRATSKARTATSTKKASKAKAKATAKMATAKRAKASAKRLRAAAKAKKPAIVSEIRSLVSDIQGRVPPKHVIANRVEDWLREIAAGVAEDAGLGGIESNPEWLRTVKAIAGPILLQSTRFGLDKAKLSGFMKDFNPKEGMKMNDALQASLEDMAVNPIADSLSNSLGNQTMNVVRKLVGEKIRLLRDGAEQAIQNFSKVADLDDVRLFYDVSKSSVRSIKDIIRNITKGEDNEKLRKQDITNLIEEVEARKVKPPMIDVVRNTVGQWTDKLDHTLQSMSNSSVSDYIRTQLVKLDKSHKDAGPRGKIEIMTEAVGPKSLAQRLALPGGARRFGLAGGEGEEEATEDDLPDRL